VNHLPKFHWGDAVCTNTIHYLNCSAGPTACRSSVGPTTPAAALVACRRMAEGLAGQQALSQPHWEASTLTPAEALTINHRHRHPEGGASSRQCRGWAWAQHIVLGRRGRGWPVMSIDQPAACSRQAVEPAFATQNLQHQPASAATTTWRWGKKTPPGGNRGGLRGRSGSAVPQAVARAAGRDGRRGRSSGPGPEARPMAGMVV